MNDDGENKTERVQLLMGPSELRAIDDWGFSHRIRTRAEAIRRLCALGLMLDRELPRLLDHMIRGYDARSITGQAMNDAEPKHLREAVRAHERASRQLIEQLLYDLATIVTSVFPLQSNIDTGESIDLARRLRSLFKSGDDLADESDVRKATEILRDLLGAFRPPDAKSQE